MHQEIEMCIVVKSNSNVNFRVIQKGKERSMLAKQKRVKLTGLVKVGDTFLQVVESVT